MLLTYGDHNLKNLNRRICLELIRFTPGGISRAELARQLGITRSAITTIINELLASGLVHEAENGPATGGRRAVMLEMNPQKGYVAGIDMGATHLAVLITDLSTQVISEVETPYNVKAPVDECIRTIDRVLNQALAQAEINLGDLLALGMGVPGPVVAEQGFVSAPPIMPGWDGFPIRTRLQTMWGRPVSIANDAELGALGEWAQGVGRGEQHLAYIKVGSGVGAGLLLNGSIYRGATGSAGEIGHITLDENGPLCSCGNHGCLEALAGGVAIAARARQAVIAGRRTQLSGVVPLESITARDVSRAARKGDHIAQQILAEAGGYLGIAVANLINLFNPSMVVVGGGVAQVGDLLLDPIRQVVRERSLRSVNQVVRIVTAVLGRRSTSMGAAVQAISNVLDAIVLEG